VPQHNLGAYRFSPDGRTLPYGIKGDQLLSMEVAVGREYRALAARSGGSNAVGRLAPVGAIHPNGRLMVDASAKIRVWDLDRGEIVATLDGLDRTDSAKFEADGSLLTCGSRGIHRWPVRPPALGAGHVWRIGPPELIHAANLPDCYLSSNRDGRVLVVGMYDAGAIVLHRGSSRSIHLGPQRDVRQVAISPDGRWVATGSWNGSQAGVFIWEAATGRRVAVLPVQDCASLVFSPDGRWLATGPQLGGEGRIWHVGSWEPGPSLGDGNHLFYSPDGTLLAHGGRDSVRLLDPETGRTLATLEDPLQGRSRFAAFTPDSTRLVYDGDESRMFHVWDLRLIRKQLADLGLDWDRPPYPPSPPEQEKPIAPLVVRVEGTELFSLSQKAVSVAEAGRWREAAELFAKVVSIQPRDRTAWRYHALGRLAIGDTEGYRAAYARFVECFSNTKGPEESNEVAWLGAIGPDAVAGLSRLVTLAEAAVASDKDSYNFLNTLGAVLYRAGRFDDAARTLKQAVDKHRRGGTAYDFLFLAMAHHHLGHTAKAQHWHDRAGRWVAAAESGALKDESYSIPLDWIARLEFLILGREAETLLGRTPRELPEDVFAR
jgi:tetratricopeptide (TPR) repeat protein